MPVSLNRFQLFYILVITVHHLRVYAPFSVVLFMGYMCFTQLNRYIYCAPLPKLVLYQYFVGFREVLSAKRIFRELFLRKGFFVNRDGDDIILYVKYFPATSTLILFNSAQSCHNNTIYSFRIWLV